MRKIVAEATVELKMPGHFEGEIESLDRNTIEIYLHNVILENVPIRLTDGTNILIKSLRFFKLAGEMLPVYDPENESVVLFETEKVTKRKPVEYVKPTDDLAS